MCHGFARGFVIYALWQFCVLIVVWRLRSVPPWPGVLGAGPWRAVVGVSWPGFGWLACGLAGACFRGAGALAGVALVVVWPGAVAVGVSRCLLPRRRWLRCRGCVAVSSLCGCRVRSGSPGAGRGCGGVAAVPACLAACLLAFLRACLLARLLVCLVPACCRLPSVGLLSCCLASCPACVLAGFRVCVPCRAWLVCVLACRPAFLPAVGGLWVWFSSLRCPFCRLASCPAGLPPGDGPHVIASGPNGLGYGSP